MRQGETSDLKRRDSSEKKEKPEKAREMIRRILGFCKRAFPSVTVFLDPSRACSQSHTLVVKRLRWRPRVYQQDRSDDFDKNHQNTNSVQLASAGADNVVKIFNIDTLTL